MKKNFIELAIIIGIIHGTVLDGIGQSHPIDETDLALVGLQCSVCNINIGFLEIDSTSSQFTYLLHPHSITKKENRYICSTCGNTIFDHSPYLSTDQYLKFKLPINQEAFKYETVNLSFNELNQMTYKINNTDFNNLQLYPPGIVIKLSTIKSLLSGNFKN